MRVGHEAGHQPGVKGADFAEHLPYVIRLRCGKDFPAYRSHFASPDLLGMRTNPDYAPAVSFE
jgi:hypothetical protein